MRFAPSHSTGRSEVSLRSSVRSDGVKGCARPRGPEPRPRWIPRMKAHCGLPCWIAFCALYSGAQQAPSGEFANLLQKASSFTQQADYSHAIPLLQQAIRMEPENASANLLLGEALLQTGHAADALTPLQKAASATPKNEAAEGFLGDAAMELGRYAMAAETFRNTTVRSPDSEQALLWWTDFSLERYRSLTFALRAFRQGRAALLKTAVETGHGDAKSRETMLRQAVGLTPRIKGVWGELGVAQSELGEEAEAEASLANARVAEPDADSTWELEAMTSAAHGDWTAANQKLVALGRRSAAELRRTLAAWPQRLTPDDAVKGEAWECLRRAAADCRLPADAAHEDAGVSAKRLFDEEQWERLAALSAPAEDSAEEWFWRGLAFARLGNCAEAIPALERGLKPGAETAASWLTYCYQLSAVRAADQLKLQGKEGAVHEIRGNILLSIRLDATQALAEYKQALTLKPNDPELLEKIADACYSQGDMEGAKQNAEAALKLNPHRIQLVKLLAQAAMSERDYPSALALLSQFGAMRPGDAWMLAQQGTAYAQTGHPDQAVQLLNAALAAGYSDERGALHFLLSVQLRKLGRAQEAKAAADEAARLAGAFQTETQGGPSAPR